nr:hypothetical protein [Tanacetum cinerariifolium]
LEMRVCRELVRDCRKLVMEVAGKGEKGINNRFQMVLQGRKFVGCTEMAPEDCFRDELDNVVEEEDRGWICFLGGNNSSGTKKHRGSNSGDGGNTGDGVKITGGVIGSGDGIGGLLAALYACTL